MSTNSYISSYKYKIDPRIEQTDASEIITYGRKIAAITRLSGLINEEKIYLSNIEKTDHLSIKIHLEPKYNIFHFSSKSKTIFLHKGDYVNLLFDNDSMMKIDPFRSGASSIAGEKANFAFVSDQSLHYMLNNSIKKVTVEGLKKKVSQDYFFINHSYLYKSENDGKLLFQTMIKRLAGVKLLLLKDSRIK